MATKGCPHRPRRRQPRTPTTGSGTGYDTTPCGPHCTARAVERTSLPSPRVDPIVAIGRSAADVTRLMSRAAAEMAWHSFMKLNAASGPDNQPDSKSSRSCPERTGDTSCALVHEYVEVPTRHDGLDTALDVVFDLSPPVLHGRPPRRSISATVRALLWRAAVRRRALSRIVRARCRAHTLSPAVRSRSPSLSAWPLVTRPELPFERNDCATLPNVRGAVP